MESQAGAGSKHRNETRFLLSMGITSSVWS